MNKTKAIEYASYCYSENLLKMLLNMDLLTDEEYSRILRISAKYYGIEK